MVNKRKKDHSKTEKRIKQRARTARNRKAKYEKMIAENPNHKDVRIWEKKLTAKL